MNEFRVCVTRGYPFNGGSLQAEAVVYDLWGRTHARFISNARGCDLSAYVRAKAEAWIAADDATRAEALAHESDWRNQGAAFYRRKQFWLRLGVKP